MILAESPLIQNLKGGKLPEMEVTVATESIINICLGLTVAAVLIMLAYKLINR